MDYLDLVNKVRILNSRFHDESSLVILKELFIEFPDIALVSSFGTESAVLLHLISEVNKSMRIIFIDTGKLFDQTLTYKNTLEKRLGLTNIEIVQPRTEQLKQLDPEGTLHVSEPDYCCHIRKVEPLSRALENTNVWISGRKRYHAGMRTELPLFELDDMRIKVNLLANWSQKEIMTYFEVNNLPEHPLFKKGYLSIGCIPCTSPTKPGENSRAGRWRGQIKTECGIHMHTAAFVNYT